MKKILISIFSIVSVFIPLFFANAAVSLVTKNITSNSVDVEITGLEASSKYTFFTQNKTTGSGTHLPFISNQNGSTSYTNLAIKPETDYIFRVYDSEEKNILFETTVTNKNIISFSPLEGKVGDVVTITGQNFSGINKILFGSTVSSVDSVSATTIKTKVPSGFLSGKITVNAIKNGVSFNLISSQIFNVTVTEEPSGISFDKLDKLIISANGLINSSNEGTTVGKYPIGSIAILKKALDSILDDYNYIKTDTLVIQSDIDELSRKLSEAIDIFADKIITSVEEPKENEVEGEEGSSSSSTVSPSQKSGFFGKAGGLVPACPDHEPCGFNEAMKLINNVITFLLFTIATPLVALIICYAGWLYLSSQGSKENVTKAKTILKNVIIGYIIGLVAWLVVKTILVSLGFTGPMYLD